MARQIKPSVGPFRTMATIFERGKERPIEVTLYPTYLECRAIGTQETYHVPYSAILIRGAEAEVKHRIKRGAL